MSNAIQITGSQSTIPAVAVHSELVSVEVKVGVLASAANADLDKNAVNASWNIVRDDNGKIVESRRTQLNKAQLKKMLGDNYADATANFLTLVGGLATSIASKLQQG